MQTNVRALTNFEAIRLESVIENEAKCNAAGQRFSDYDLEQEGRWIMGVGQFQPGYASSLAESINSTHSD